MTNSSIFRVFLIVFVSMARIPALLASSEAPGKPNEDKKDKKEKKKDKPKKDKGEGKQAGKDDKKGEGENKENEAPKEVIASTGYVHEWAKFPTVRGKNLLSDREVTTIDNNGTVNIVVFMASWCIPCQRIMEDLKNLENKYKPIQVNFIYVFAHDLEKDATDFSREYNVNAAMVADFELLKTFHDPELPSIYVSDRQGWIVNRYVKADQIALKDMDNFLKWTTAI
jgi:thiol-disulfide isomerase/thioredoxin